MDAEALTRDEMAEQLGIAVGETIVLEPVTRDNSEAERRNTAGGMLIALGACVICLPAWLLLLAGNEEGFACTAVLGLIVAVVGAVICLGSGVPGVPVTACPSLLRGDSAIEADAYGLTLTYPVDKQSNRLSWTEIQGLKPVYGPPDSEGCRTVRLWIVSAERNRHFHFLADSPGIDRVLTAIRHVLEAHQQGRPLSDPSSVPESVDLADDR